LVGERAGDEALPDAGGPDQDHVVVFLDPAAGGELAHHGLVELAARGIVDGFEARVGELELGLLQRPGKALVLAGVPLGLDEETEALVESQGRHVGLVLLLRPGGRHGGELEGVKLFERGGGKHRRSFHW
jgi:hypothetical protein